MYAMECGTIMLSYPVVSAAQYIYYIDLLNAEITCKGCSLRLFQDRFVIIASHSSLSYSLIVKCVSSYRARLIEDKSNVAVRNV